MSLVILEDVNSNELINVPTALHNFIIRRFEDLDMSEVCHG